MSMSVSICSRFGCATPTINMKCRINVYRRRVTGLAQIRLTFGPPVLHDCPQLESFNASIWCPLLGTASYLAWLNLPFESDVSNRSTIKPC